MPAVQRARRRQRPGLAGHPGRARRRRVGGHRPEGVDHVGPPVRLRRAAGPHRPRRPPSARASPTSSSTCTSPASRCGPLRHITGEIDFNEVFLDAARVPDAQRVGAVGDGWRVANATLSGERQMVSGVGLGRRRPHRRLGHGPAHPPRPRDRAGGPTRSCARSSCAVHSEERIRGVDQPAGARRAEGRSAAGARELDRQGAPGRAQPAHPAAGHRPARPRRHGLGERRRRPTPSRCPTRSRACCAAGPTPSRAAPPRSTRTSSAERVLGLPREPDPWHDAPWRDVPRG